MSTDLKQGTAEWRQARVGRPSASMVAAIWNGHPYTSRAKYMRLMVDEALGNIRDISSPAMDWGTEHEDEAAKVYAFLYAGEHTVEETGYWTKGDLGASPDRLVGHDGLLEIKCPYGIRNDIAPDFKSIDEQPHYWHQVQCQMYVLNRQWCDFLQWTPHDHKLERVYRDPEWFDQNIDALAAFMEEYAEMLSKAASGGPEERLAASEGWAIAVENYAQAASEAARAKAELDEAKQTLIDLMEASEIDVCENEQAKVQKVPRKGSVDYRAMAEALMPDAAKDRAEEFRRKDTESWRIDIK